MSISSKYFFFFFCLSLSPSTLVFFSFVYFPAESTLWYAFVRHLIIACL